MTRRTSLAVIALLAAPARAAIEHDETPDAPALLEMAWAIIANAGNGDWRNESPEWQAAAKVWREQYFGSSKKTKPKTA